MKIIQYTLNGHLYMLSNTQGEGSEHLAYFLWRHELRSFNFKWWILNSDCVVDVDDLLMYKDQDYICILIKDVSDACVYFANPYHSWERGLNENTNGLVRQYFSKKI